MSRNNKSKFKYVLAESNGFIICVDKADLLVPDAANVRLNDKVKFKYGVEVFDGVITYMSVCENEALEQMKIQSKEKRSKPESTSEVLGKRGRHSVNKDQDVTVKVSELPVRSKAKNAAKILGKMKKERAEAFLDLELTGLAAIDSNQNVVQLESDNTDDSIGSSISLSDEGITLFSKKMIAIYSSTESDSEDKKIERVTSKDKNTTSSEKQSNSKKMDKATAEDNASEMQVNATEKSSVDKQMHQAASKDNTEGQESEILSGNAATGDQKSGKKNVSEKRKSCDGGSEGSTLEKKGRKGETKLRRNLQIYKGGDTYLYSQDTPNAVKIHPSYEVYTLKNLLEKSLSHSKSASICCRFLIDNTYTEDALANASAFGFPPRGKGSLHFSQSQVLPRLDPKGIDAIMAAALEHQVTNKTWRPKMSESQLRNSITNKVSLAKKTFVVPDPDGKINQPSSSESDL